MWSADVFVELYLKLYFERLIYMLLDDGRCGQ